MSKTDKYNTIYQALSKIGIDSFEDLEAVTKAVTTIFTRKRFALGFDALKKEGKSWKEIGEAYRLNPEAARKIHLRYLGGASEK